ncbi:MAG: ATPase domain-containing protein [Candidatus Thermoplasmatota archaeon]
MIKTYIQGFDEALGGGIPEGHVILVSGTPGTMKSSLCSSILYNNARHDERKGLYISLEETKESLAKMMKNLGMADIDDKKLFIVDIGRLRLDHKNADQDQDWLRVLADYITRRARDDGISLIVVDSLTALYSLIDLKNPRQDLFHFFGLLKSLGITTFLVSEMMHGTEIFGPYREDFLADGTFFLKQYEVGETDIQLRIRCVKMRHANHARGYFALLHRHGGFMVTRVISD